MHRKNGGGLGVRNLTKMNQALLCKWSWQFANERDPLWRLVMNIKFREVVGGWNTCDIRGGYGSSLWKKIRKDWITFHHNVAFSSGYGRRLCFWKDTWCIGDMLCNTFPTLFNLVAHKDVRVVYVWDASREEEGWSLVFVRSFNDYDVEEVERFLCYLHSKKIKPLQEDQMLVKESKMDGFSIRLMYRMFCHSPSIAFPFWSIWNLIVPPKVVFFFCVGSILG